MPFFVILRTYLGVAEYVVHAPYHDTVEKFAGEFMRQPKFIELSIQDSDGKLRFLATRS